MAEACKNCHFSKPSGIDYRVECRRFPPLMAQGLGQSCVAAPLVLANGWCGEWAAHGGKPKVEPETSQERMWKWFWR